MLQRIKNGAHKLWRRVLQRRYRRQFHNHTLSVFSSNCVGGCMLHDVGARFNSPFVNLYMNAADYLAFLSAPAKYSALPMQEIPSDTAYPVAAWGDLTVHFVHYKTFDEAAVAFQRRLERVNYDNLFVLFVERDGCTYEDLQRFDALPYAHKVVFTHRPYADIASAVYIEGFETEACLGNVMHWDRRLGRKIYDRFPFVRWLNGEPVQ